MRIPLTLGASVHAELQGFSSFPQLPPPELRTGTTTIRLAPELPWSNSEPAEGQMRGRPAILPAKGRLSGPLAPLLPSQGQGCQMGASGPILPNEEIAWSCCLPFQESTTVPGSPGMNILGPGTEDAQVTEGIESKMQRPW